MKFIILLNFLLPPVSSTPISSLIVPGSYQIKTEHKRGYGYLLLDAVLMGGYFYTRKKMGSIRESYIEFAREHATSRVINDPVILNLLEKYRSYDEYYEMLYREARQIYPDDPAGQDEYVKENIKTTLYWNWATVDDWYSYQDKRRFYRELSNKTVVLMGFMLTNHLASFVDALITDRLLKKKARVRTSLSAEEISTEVSVNF